MDLNKYTARLREDLVTAAALGDEKTQATVPITYSSPTGFGPAVLVGSCRSSAP